VLGSDYGTVTITVSANLDTLAAADTIITFTVSDDPTMLMVGKRSGVVNSTTSYELTGHFVLSQTENNGLLLDFQNNYVADDGLPGLYIYLSNNPNSISDAYEIGMVTTFSGAHNYTIVDVGLLDYNYILYYCKPFNVKVGHGNIN